VPSYELEITDPDGGAPASGTHESSDSLGVDDTFEYEGGTLLVTAVEAAEGQGFDAKLVCAPQGGRPHYF
jgi:hypothetical protein